MSKNGSNWENLEYFPLLTIHLQWTFQSAAQRGRQPLDQHREAGRLYAMLGGALLLGDAQTPKNKHKGADAGWRRRISQDLEEVFLKWSTLG